MSVGPWRHLRWVHSHMSAFEGKADIADLLQMSAYDPKRTLGSTLTRHSNSAVGRSGGTK